MKPGLLPLGFAGLLFAAGLARGADAVNPRFSGMPFTRTWLAEDYGAASTNRAVLQHPGNGFMYFANAGGVLEFDGARWKLYPVPGGASVSGLAVGPRGRIWFSTDDQVGYLEPNARGALQAGSALGRLPADEPPIFPPGACLGTADGVYFTTRDRVIRFGSDDAKPARIWRFESEISPRLWVSDGRLHVRAANSVYRLEQDKFGEVAGLRMFAFATRPSPHGGWQMLNRDGVRRWEGAFVPVAPNLPAIVSPLEGDVALGAVFLSDGRIAMGTTRSGLLVCDASGHRQQAINRTHGLLSDRVEALCADREGGVWLAFRNGIMRLQLDSPFARHGTGMRRIDSTPTALALHHGELYAGGGEGVWRRDAAGEFHPIAEVPYYVRSLVRLDDELFITGVELRRIGAGDTAEKLGDTYHGLVALSTAPGIVVHGTHRGLAFDRKTGTGWVSAGRYERIPGTTVALCEWPAGVIWAASHTTGIWRVDFREGIKPDAPAKNYRQNAAAVAGANQYNVDLFPWAGGLGGSVGGRFVRFDARADCFVAGTQVTGLPRGPSDFLLGSPVGARPDADGSIWWQLRGLPAAIVRLVPEAPGQWHAETPPGPGLPSWRATALLHDHAANTLWLAGAGALISRDLGWRPTGPRPLLKATIRRIEDARGNLVWADGLASGRPGAPLPLTSMQRALRFYFSAPTFPADHSGRVHTQFRTRLEGLESGWSSWQSETQRDFTNLPGRVLALHVQARDEAGRMSIPAAIWFVIPPPWWFTAWAMAGYVAMGLASMGGLVAWRTRALRQRAQKLENLVGARTDQLQRTTEELRHSNGELARLHQIERDEKLAARLDEEKARLEMLRYQLNPHFLYNALNSIRALIFLRPPEAGEMVSRLADLCRVTLTRTEDFGPVSEEFAMLHLYLDMEKTRWRDKLEVMVDVDPAAANEAIPPFLLLPLVENALKHGRQTSAGVLRLRLAARRTTGPDGRDKLVLEVANTGQWLERDQVTSPSTGIGLENLRQRLKRYYPNSHALETQAADGWVVVTLWIYRCEPQGKWMETDAVPRSSSVAAPHP